jgi:hypothetical protein
MHDWKKLPGNVNVSCVNFECRNELVQARRHFCPMVPSTSIASTNQKMGLRKIMTIQSTAMTLVKANRLPMRSPSARRAKGTVPFENKKRRKKTQNTSRRRSTSQGSFDHQESQNQHWRQPKMSLLSHKSKSS